MSARADTHWQRLDMALPFLVFTTLRGRRGFSFPCRGSHSTDGEEGPGVHHDEAVERFYTTRAWRKARAAVLSEHGGLCQNCLSKGLVEPAVHVHHKIPLTADNINDPRITLDSSNMMALCSNCHSEIHKKKRWRTDEYGRVIL